MICTAKSFFEKWGKRGKGEREKREKKTIKGKNMTKSYSLGGKEIYFPPIFTVHTWVKKYFGKVGE